MYVVAIAELANPTGDLGALAKDLGTTIYELRLALNGGFPAVVLLTVDVSAATSAVRAIERHGSRAVSADRRQFQASSALKRVQEFTFEPSAFATGNPTSPSRSNAAADRLAYEDLFALLRATHRTQETVTREEKERKFRPGMTLATGGLVVSKTTTRQVVTHTDTREQVLYLFPRSGLPWILREHEARYGGLGPALAPTSGDNFRTTLAKLRERAPTAHYDERLASARTVRGIADGADATDLLANLIVADLRATSAR